ncbi:MAG TPA: Rpn family recombination-promoting nuclease/putative transposase [Thermoanaerobaculia bacterium]|nr:Rpn family recombination-promoting nuclease/putative transposase [Thermoanaerobaculia bacterium]
MTGNETCTSAYRNLFSHPRMVRDLLRGFLRQEWSTWLDLGSLERRAGAERLLDRVEGTSVWRLRWQGGSSWLYLLLAFREEEDPCVPLRMELLKGLLYEGLLRRCPQRRPWLPPAVPVVLYSGAERWTASLEALDLFLPLLPSLQRHAPRTRCLLLDAVHDSIPEDAGDDNLVALLCGLERTRAVDDAIPAMWRVAELTASPEDDGLRRAWTAFLGEWLADRQPLPAAAAGGVLA